MILQYPVTILITQITWDCGVPVLATNSISTNLTKVIIMELFMNVKKLNISHQFFILMTQVTLARSCDWSSNTFSVLRHWGTLLGDIKRTMLGTGVTFQIWIRFNLMTLTPQSAQLSCLEFCLMKRNSAMNRVGTLLRKLSLTLTTLWCQKP